MKRDVFLYAVIAFAIFSSFVFYLDQNKDCGSFTCVVSYISGEGVPEIGESQLASEYYELKEVNSAKDFFDNAVSVIIAPFVNPVDEDSPLLQPAGPVINLLSPNPVTRNIDKPIIITGLNFVSDFAVYYRPQGASEWITICATNPIFSAPGCTFVSSTEVRANFAFSTSPLMFPAGDYEVMYVDLTVITSPLSSAPVILQIQDLPIVSLLDPNPISAGVQTQITVTGSNFIDNFGISIRDIVPFGNPPLPCTVLCWSI